MHLSNKRCLFFLWPSIQIYERQQKDVSRELDRIRLGIKRNLSCAPNYFDDDVTTQTRRSSILSQDQPQTGNTYKHSVSGKSQLYYKTSCRRVSKAKNSSQNDNLSKKFFHTDNDDVIVDSSRSCHDSYYDDNYSIVSRRSSQSKTLAGDTDDSECFSDAEDNYENIHRQESIPDMDVLKVILNGIVSNWEKNAMQAIQEQKNCVDNEEVGPNTIESNDDIKYDVDGDNCSVPSDTPILDIISETNSPRVSNFSTQEHRKGSEKRKMTSGKTNALKLHSNPGNTSTKQQRKSCKSYSSNSSELSQLKKSPRTGIKFISQSNSIGRSNARLNRDSVLNSNPQDVMKSKLLIQDKLLSQVSNKRQTNCSGTSTRFGKEKKWESKEGDRRPRNWRRLEDKQKQRQRPLEDLQADTSSETNISGRLKSARPSWSRSFNYSGKQSTGKQYINDDIDIGTNQEEEIIVDQEERERRDKFRLPRLVSASTSKSNEKIASFSAGNSYSDEKQSRKNWSKQTILSSRSDGGLRARMQKKVINNNGRLPNEFDERGTDEKNIYNNAKLHVFKDTRRKKKGE